MSARIRVTVEDLETGDREEKVIGFGDEEGVRFGTTLLGSRAVSNKFDFEALKAKGAILVAVRAPLFGSRLVEDLLHPRPDVVEHLLRGLGEREDLRDIDGHERLRGRLPS